MNLIIIYLILFVYENKKIEEEIPTYINWILNVMMDVCCVV